MLWVYSLKMPGNRAGTLIRPQHLDFYGMELPSAASLTVRTRRP